jgi:hypothetical protein
MLLTCKVAQPMHRSSPQHHLKLGDGGGQETLNVWRQKAP